MATPKLPLRDGPRAIAWEALVRFLTTDPDLRRVVRAWRAWKGEKGDDELPESAAQVPWVRLTPTFPECEREATFGGDLGNVVNAPMDVRVETAVAGTRLADGANLWDAIEARLLGRDGPTRHLATTTLAAAGINDVEVLQPAIAVNPAGTIAVAAGLIRFHMLIQG